MINSLQKQIITYNKSKPLCINRKQTLQNVSGLTADDEEAQ